MNKQELQRLKKQVEEILAKIGKALSETEVVRTVRLQPKCGERYYYLTDYGDILSVTWQNDPIDFFRFNIGNCFKTQEEAEDYKENLLTKQALKDLALELNNGVEIDWEDIEQSKYCLTHSAIYSQIELGYTSYRHGLSQVYCLEGKDFLEAAIKRIGEEKIIKLIKSGV